MEQPTECSSAPERRAPSPIRCLRGGSSSRRRARPRQSCGIPGTRRPARWPIWGSSGARCSVSKQRTRRTTRSISRAESDTRCVSSSEPRQTESGGRLDCRPFIGPHPQPDGGPQSRARRCAPVDSYGDGRAQGGEHLPALRNRGRGDAAEGQAVAREVLTGGREKNGGLGGIEPPTPGFSVREWRQQGSNLLTPFLSAQAPSPILAVPRV